jgi:unsaturated pyranuronate lyase
MSYFESGARAREAGVRGAIVRIGDQPSITAAPGVQIQPVAGGRLLVARVTLEPHSEAPVHTHDEEQMGIVVSGWLDFDMDGEVRRLLPGDVYHAPPGVPHGARAGDELCVVVDVFSPPRAALIAFLAQTAGQDGA